jgi:aromatic ring-cleaving dioxygenase
MTSLTVAAQIEALRNLVVGAVEDWNAEHPHRLRSHLERAAIYVTHVYADGSDHPTYAISVECSLVGPGALTFHGSDLATVAEHARLTVEHKLDVELRARAERDVGAHDDERRFALAV